MKRLCRSMSVVLAVLMVFTLTSCDLLFGPKNERPNDNINVALGWPDEVTSSDARNRNNYLIEREAYALSFNDSKHIPNWVSWHVAKEDIGSLDRVKKFSPDTSLPEGFTQVKESEYKNSGFDKGHMCPSHARSSKQYMIEQTYLLTNIVPQNPNNNQKAWRLLEKEIQDSCVYRGQEAYVICGPWGVGGQVGYDSSIYGGAGTEVNHIGKSKIEVPAYTWKVAIVFPEGDDDIARLNRMDILDYVENPGITDKTKMKVYAVWMPNNQKVKPKYEEHLVSIDFIEEKTGYDFFAFLDDRKEAEIEAFNSRYDATHGRL